MPPAPLTWHLLLAADGAPGWRNMALDQAMLDLADRDGRAFLRLYRWRPACLSFGRHEPAARRYDRRRISALGLATVRRPSGGRAVWHDEELTYAVAAPAAAFGSLTTAYQVIHRMLAEAIATLGVPATLAPTPPALDPLDAGACFARPVGGEVVAAGGKLVGSAQLRQGSALLQHGSLLLAGDQALVDRLLTQPSGTPSAARPLAGLLRRPVPFHEAAVAVAAAAERWPGTWSPLETAALETAAKPHEARFRSPEWTWRR